MKAKDTKRNIVVYVLTLLLIAGVIYGKVAADPQNKKFTEQSSAYQKAINQMQQGQFGEAEKSLKSLLEQHSDSYILMWQCAISLMQQGKYEEADDYFLKAQKQRPFLVQNQQYLIQYGQVLYHAGNYKKAEKYLAEAKRLNTKPELTQQIEPVLLQVKQKLIAK